MTTATYTKQRQVAYLWNSWASIM